MNKQDLRQLKIDLIEETEAYWHPHLDELFVLAQQAIEARDSKLTISEFFLADPYEQEIQNLLDLLYKATGTIEVNIPNHPLLEKLEKVLEAYTPHLNIGIELPPTTEDQEND